MPDSVLILRLSALGDVIHTLPAVAILRASFPDARIAWAVERPYRELVAAVAPVDEVIPLATKAWRRAPLRGETRAGLRRLRRDLRAAAAGGVAVDFQGLMKSAILGWIARASVRYGFTRDAIREPGALLFLNRTVSPPPGIHVVEMNQVLARAVVEQSGGTTSAAPVEPDLRAWAAAPTGKLAPLVAAPPVVLLPGAGRAGKQWNIDCFRSLASIVVETLGHPVVVAWGPGERELAAAIVEEGKGVMAPSTDLRELAFLLARARLVIGGDTGPLHLAAALGTRVLGLYGPTDPRRNGPWGQTGSVVESFTGGKTMNEISVTAVAGKAEEILA
ncbi:MAG: lipopolysaccharide heptosyltransferase I [Thermoanaerobaculia bacterium]